MGYKGFFRIYLCMWVLLLYDSTGKGKSYIWSLSEGDDVCDGPCLGKSQITVTCMSDAINDDRGTDARLINSGMVSWS